MAYDIPRPGTLKRKRRRREDRPAVSAKLFLDSNLKGEVGVLSQDLVEDLFPGHLVGEDGAHLYAAVTSWTPNPAAGETNWSILSFRAQKKDEKQLPPSTLRFPTSASGTQAFVNLVQSLSPNRTLRQNAAIEVRVTDVCPLTLDTIYVSVDTEAIKKFSAVQKRYGGGFGQANGSLGKKGSRLALEHGQGQGSETDEAATRKALVNDALGRVSVVHTGDFLPLDLAHPVTHVSAPPGKILACEPVAQGLVAHSTKIVLVSAAERRQNALNSRSLMSPRLEEETDEDTTNESFYSAVEENTSPAKPLRPVVTSKATTDHSNTEDLFEDSTEESNLSDDSDDMISLAKPGLTDQPSGLSSAVTSATPRPFGSRTNGISTPGSVYSHMSTSTIRGGQATRSKVFQAQGLLERISDELLHPRPSSDEDEEARVYVDATSLARLGCFSGDWVKLEAVENHGLPQLSAFGALDGSAAQAWRPVKVFGLPE
ncbi:AAA-domain-containing protein, partial [Hortaea werneckii]